MSDKNAAFHRLAAKRVEALADQIRIFSNLSGPSYEWTAAEVESYFSQIEASLSEAKARFMEQKHWKLSAGAQPTPEAMSAPEDNETDFPAPEIRESPDDLPTDPVEDIHPSVALERRRKRTIGQLIADAKNDTEMLPEMLVLQREVIANLQQSLDECRAQHGA